MSSLKKIDQLIKDDLRCNMQLEKSSYIMAKKMEEDIMGEALEQKTAQLMLDLISYRTVLDRNSSPRFTHPKVPNSLILLG